MSSPTRSFGVPRVPEEPVTVLQITPADGDHLTLRQILKVPDWHVHQVPNCRQARIFLMELPVAVVLSEVTLADGDWKCVLQETRKLQVAPALVVSSRLADERLWAEVLNLGGHDVLLTPFEPAEVERVIGSASRAGVWRKRPDSTHILAAAV